MGTPIHVVIMGVSGSGKTTIAGILQDRWGWEFAEADEFHPQANIVKMQSGTPLTDADRWPWLELIRQWMTEQEKQGKSTIITCSALKRSYRDLLRKGAAGVVFMHLDGDRMLLANRLAARTNHFMPTSLLESQYATLEPLQEDEIGTVIDIAGTPAQIATQIENKLVQLVEAAKIVQTRTTLSSVPETSPDQTSAVQTTSAQVGLYGLGVMGTALSRNLARHGLRTAVMNLDYAQTEQFIAVHGTEGEFIPAANIADFVASLERPRKILVMVTAGAPVDSVLSQLTEHLESGDLIVDMGNSHFLDTRRREVDLRQKGIYFIGCGTSGGESGALNGPALMLGGAPEAFQLIASIFTAIAARTEIGETCANYVGADGAGHLTKTLHNGIEYADMEVIAEIYQILRSANGMANSQISQVFKQWNRGKLNSYLLEISAKILQYSTDGEDFIEKISDIAAHKGTGAWSSVIGIELGVDLTMLSASLSARFSSAAQLRKQWKELLQDEALTENGVYFTDGSACNLASDGLGCNPDDLREALLLAKLVAYTQGLSVIAAASNKYGWGIDLAQVCRGWRAGCIIRGEMLDEFANILAADADPNALILRNYQLVQQLLPALRKVVGAANLAQIPVPALSAALIYLDTLNARRLPTALIQAQRDYFGAHGFARIDREGTGFHGPWHTGV